MIANLCGELIEKDSDSVVVDASGVGYLVYIPLSTYYKLPDLKNRVSLFIHTAVKDDAIELYGFFTTGERGLFQMLISVTGVGPKLARNILSGISVVDFLSSVAKEDLHALTAVPGLGKKTAQRIFLELKEKAALMIPEGGSLEGGGEGSFSPAQDDALSALINLGYKQSVAQKAVREASKTLSKEGDSEPEVEKLIKASLQVLLSN